jgi:hypothetical protein
MLISQETGIHFEIRPVKDGKYGSPDPKAPGKYLVKGVFT